MKELLETIKEKTFYSNEEVKDVSLKYFFENELVSSTWMSKYAAKNNKSEFVETSPTDMHKRMAKEFARIEKKFDIDLNGKSNTLSDYGQIREKLTEDKIFNLFDRFKQIIPQGSVMTVLGNNHLFGSLSNCIVLPEIYDSYGGILYTDQQLVQLYKRRCGVGLDISTLRPSGTFVKNAAGSTTGAVSFMERYSNTTREVAQNGRRGALMISIDVNHPDVEQFALIKQNAEKVTGANISIKLRDSFMKAVEADEDYILRFPVDAIPEEAIFTKKIRARKLWETIIHCAWNTAEPGLMFWDKQHNYSTSSMYPKFKNIGTNPCAEIAMGNDSCRLIANNMFSCVINPFTDKAKFDFNKWYEMCYEAQRLMDDLVELELEAINKIFAKIDKDPEPNYIKQVERETWKNLYESGKNGRRTGLGFTALGDTLAALGLKYDSEEGIKMAKKIMKEKVRGEWDSSIDMSVERGCFTDWNADIDEESEFILMLKKEFPDIYERNKKLGRRNISISTVAPTGTVSMMAQLADGYNNTTSGMEPMFNTEPNVCWYIRRKKINPSDKNTRVDFVDNMGDSWQEFKVFHSGFKMWAKINYPDTELNSLSTEDLKKLLEKSPYHGAGASEISWEKRIDMQAVIQKYTTHSVSSTINLPNNVEEGVIGNIYMESWKKGLKGVTVYRDGCRSGVLISDKKEDLKPRIIKCNAPKRPEVLDCDIHMPLVGGTQWIVLVGLLEGDPYEVFAFKKKNISLSPKFKHGKTKKVKSGRYDLEVEGTVFENLKDLFETDEQEALTRMTSFGLRHGGDIKFAYDQLQKSEGTVVSFSKAIARTLKKYIKDDDFKKFETLEGCENGGSGCNVVREDGCVKCLTCGLSKCT